MCVRVCVCVCVSVCVCVCVCVCAFYLKYKVITTVQTQKIKNLSLVLNR